MADKAGDGKRSEAKLLKGPVMVNEKKKGKGKGGEKSEGKLNGRNGPLDYDSLDTLNNRFTFVISLHLLDFSLANNTI